MTTADANLQSPRVRGKPAVRAHRGLPLPSTPACAGKTRAVISAPDATTFNPRVCGENSCRRNSTLPSTPQPPRVRGKLEPRPLHAASFPQPPRVRGKQVGIKAHPHMLPSTPACAGETPAKSIPWRPVSLNPRVCGENTINWDRVLNLAPQSPRVRGKPEKFAKGLLDHASTPACAGKTTISCSSSSLPALNPRVCGENPTASPCNADDVPQPPRVRGKLQILTPVAPGQASTPACAGKTGAQSARAVRFSLNPRVCGENSHDHP